MFRILVANSKGGCGKTTLTTTLAGHFARSGKRTTLVDCDPQGSSLAWCGLRAAHLAPVHALASNDPSYGLSAGWLLRIPPTTDVLLIDTPAGLRAHEFERFARHADVLLIPVVPSPIDLRATLVFIDMVRKLQEVRSGRLRVALIANRLRERSNSAKQLETTLERMTQAAKIRVRDSQTYVGLADSGRSVFDDDSSVSRAHREDWNPLLQWLEERATAQRQDNVTPLVPSALKNGARDASGLRTG
ncbi:ParA family protein [Dokdonella soli]|uniref:ParA family protein n=1 Tax=Dokdonella soli TaxID=529810 RepID=A0ABN1IDF1_9GAMM